MKTNALKLLLMGGILFCAGFLASCGGDDDDATPQANKAALTAAITAANTTLAASVEGTAEGQYTAGSKAVFQTAINNAQSVVDNAASTQTQVDNAVVSLAAAAATFEAAKILPIAPADLIARWKFDEGTGLTAADASGNGRNGTLTVGSEYAGGGGVPTWVADRKGTAAKALHFTGGGHIEVPSNAAFNPTEITIATWVKLDSMNTADGIYADNYIVSQNYWDGYKFQTQGAKKIFGTVHADPGIYDRDNESPTLWLKKWYHVAMTYKDGHMIFYINGIMVKDWDNTPGAIKTIADRFDFLIGAELPNAKITEDPGYVINHFEGSMDEVRLYKKALTGTQITSIYNQEK